MNTQSRQGTATLAVLIDADNAAPAIIEGLLAEVAKYGVAAVKRIYGDWTKPNLSGWKDCLLSHSIQPIQQFRYTVGKNATDSAMIIDAMDLLYTGRFDGFCLVSSDSDFTRLASRIREQGLTVYGFGERKTPKPFVTACDKFIYSDVLRSEAEADESNAPARRRSGGELRQDSRLVRLLQSAAQAVSDEEGWTTLGSMGTHIAKQAPEFDSRNYGYGKLSELVVATGLFETETRNGGNNKTIWVRLKRRTRQGEEPRGQQPERQQERSERPQERQQERQQDRQQERSERSERSERQQDRPQDRQQERSQDRQQDRQQERQHERHGGGRATAASEPVAPQAEEQRAAATSAADAEPMTADVEAVMDPAMDLAQAAPVTVISQEGQQAEQAQEAAEAPEARKSGRNRRPSRRPDVRLSETPWPIESSVLAPVAAPTETQAAVSAAVAAAAADEVQAPAAPAQAAAESGEAAEAAEAAAPPARKRRSTASRKRAPKAAASE
ncbi:NYN domain-containing protein [Paracidovorax citrulli]